MRKFVIALLLAGAAASPALAQDHDNGRWHRDQQQQQQGDRGQAHEERQQQREQARQERFNGGNFSRGDAERQQHFQMQQQVQDGQAGSWEGRRFERVQNVAPQQVTPQQAEQVRQRWNGDRGNWNRGGFTGTQQVQPVEPSRQRWSGDRTWSRPGTDYRQQSQYRDGTRWASGGWDRDWRNDRRYDWRSYREHHRSIFRIGVYFDPFGYGYRPFNIGYRLIPAYYGQQYWIDPSMYSLPYPPPGTEWVRYWNDALLVDVYSGEVVDVIHNFFW